MQMEVWKYYLLPDQHEKLFFLRQLLLWIDVLRDCIISIIMIQYFDDHF